MFTSAPTISRKNNFDLIRLFAALQVVIWHLKTYLGLTVPTRSFFDGIKYFPGVPVFFVISGFLIYSSFDRNKDLKQYFKNRILRIFPALWVAFFILFGIIYYFGYEAGSANKLVKWVVAQLTLFQLYTPEGIRAYIDGNPNHSLWTIRVEFGFYILVPVFFWLARKMNFISMKLLIVILMILSYGYHYYVRSLRPVNMALYSVLDNDVFPYLFYFLAGVLSYLYFDKLKRFYIGKGMFWLALYLAYVVVIGVYMGLYDQEYFINGYGLVGFLILSQTVISFAFTRPGLSHDLLKGNDISYGLYLYHLVIIGIFFKNGHYANNWAFLPIVSLTVAAAYFSWVLVEKPALRLKNVPWPGLLLFGFGSVVISKIKKVF